MRHQLLVHSASLLVTAALAACAPDVAAPGASRASVAPSAAVAAASTPCAFERKKNTMRLLADCSTSQTIWVPDGVTLDGAKHTITAVDPADGHFRGAIIENAGATANVRDVRLTASIANNCDADDDRLAGIRFTDASGTISGNVLTGVTQRNADGTTSGCQEGWSIWARSRSWSGTTYSVEISDNTVTDYLKEGIWASANVAARVIGNTLRGSGPQPNQAQYGIEVTTSVPGRIEKNRVSDNVYTGSYPAYAGGINSDSSTGLVVVNNEVTRSSAGIQLYMSRNAQVTSNDLTGDRSTPCAAFAPGEPCRFGVQISGSDAKLTGNKLTMLDVGIDILQPARAFDMKGNKFRDVTQEVRGTAAP
jgi:parallel beta-helix repeat protein